MLILKQVQDDISASPALGSLYDSDNSFLYRRSSILRRRCIFSFTRLFRQTQRSRCRQVARKSAQKSTPRKIQRLRCIRFRRTNSRPGLYAHKLPTDSLAACARIYGFPAGCSQRAASDV